MWSPLSSRVVSCSGDGMPTGERRRKEEREVGKDDVAVAGNEGGGRMPKEVRRMP